MIVDLPNTTTPAVGKKLQELRDSGGVVALGRVLTLLIETDQSGLETAVAAANSASRMHPSRIIVLVSADAKVGTEPHLDAQIRVGGDAGASEVIVLTAFGEAASNEESIVTGLLLPDAPIVAWWPEGGPANPSQSVMGRIASRRITDSAKSSKPLDQLRALAQGYSAGDGDMAWTRITLWRSQLAALLDQYADTQVNSVEVVGSLDSPSAYLLGQWLAIQLNAPVTYQSTHNSVPVAGIQGVQIKMGSVELSVSREATIAQIEQTGKPTGSVLLPPRTLHDCLVEDLRFLGEDIAYANVLKSMVATK